MQYKMTFIAQNWHTNKQYQYGTKHLQNMDLTWLRDEEQRINQTFYNNFASRQSQKCWRIQHSSKSVKYSVHYKQTYGTLVATRRKFDDYLIKLCNFE